MTEDRPSYSGSTTRRRTRRPQHLASPSWLRPVDRVTTTLSALFPTSERSAFSLPLIVGGYAAGLAVGVVVLVLRQTGVSPMNTVWAEDGAVYLHDSLQLPFSATLLRPYGGYVQIFPRLAVQITRLFPLAKASGSMALIGDTSIVLLVLLVYHAARAHVQSIALRMLVASGMVFLPLALAELTNNIVNVSWWLIYAAFWAILWRPRTWAGRVVATVVCALAVGSNPVALLLAPLIAARLLVLRDWREHASTMGFVVGAVVQAVGSLSSGPVYFSHGPVASIAKQFSIRVGLGWLGGWRVTNAIWRQDSALAALVGAVLLSATIVLCVAHRDKRVRVFAAFAVTLSVVIFVVPIFLRWSGALENPADSLGELGSRYSAVPVLLLLALLGVGMDAATRDRRSRRGGVVLVALLLVPIWVLDFRYFNGRTGGPMWDEQVRAATAACESPAGTATLQISPHPLTASISCSDLRMGPAR